MASLLPATAALVFNPSPNTNVTGQPATAGQKIGAIEEGKKLAGSEIKDQQSKTIGKLEDAVVDLESGRILYTVASINGGPQRIAIAPALLTMHRSGKGHVLSFDVSKLSGAPTVSGDANELGNTASVSQVFQFYGVPTWWEGSAGSFNNVHKVSALPGKAVKDVANADLGKVDDVILDLQAGRVPFVLFTMGTATYAIPPNAFTLSGDKQTLVTGIDKNTFNTAPRIAKNNVQALANASTATAIYQHYGKQAYFNAPGALTPTSDRTNSQIFPGKGRGKVVPKTTAR